MNAWQKFKASGEAAEALAKAEEVIREDTRALGTKWRVRYRRANWKPQSWAYRYFEKGGTAWRFHDKLLSGDRPDLSPVTVRLERVYTLGDWEAVSGT